MWFWISLGILIFIAIALLVINKGKWTWDELADIKVAEYLPQANRDEEYLHMTDPAFSWRCENANHRNDD